MNRPKIKPKLSYIDYIIEIFSCLCLICLIILPIINFKELPDIIPNHYNITGQPDSSGNKTSIWTLPLIGIVLFVGLTILNKYPHIFNYPVKVTTENAERLYTQGTKTIRILKLLTTLLFLFLNFKTIRIGLNQTEDINNYVLISIISASLLLTAIMIYKMNKTKTNK